MIARQTQTENRSNMLLSDLERPVVQSAPRTVGARPAQAKFLSWAAAVDPWKVRGSSVILHHHPPRPPTFAACLIHFCSNFQAPNSHPPKTPHATRLLCFDDKSILDKKLNSICSIRYVFRFCFCSFRFAQRPWQLAMPRCCNIPRLKFDGMAPGQQLSRSQDSGEGQGNAGRWNGGRRNTWVEMGTFR